MVERMNTAKPWNAKKARREAGAILILVAVSIVVLFMFAALAIDLGRMYVVKSQLQNAADSGALRGAKELDGTEDGCERAILEALNGALQNAHLFGANAAQDSDFRPLEDTDFRNRIKIYLSNHPYSGTWTEATSTSICPGNPANYYYVKVETASGGILQYLARVSGIITGEAKAVAVAGSSICEGMPLYVCVLPGGDAQNNYGYVPGRAYEAIFHNSSTPAGPGNVGYLHPTLVPDDLNDKQACNAGGGLPDLNAAICKGEGPCYRPGDLRCTTTVSSGDNVPDSLNTRFNNEPPANVGKEIRDNWPQYCAPDKNIRQYCATIDSCLPPNDKDKDVDPNDVNASYWMEGNPDRQVLALNDDGTSAPSTGQQGVWWSYVTPPTVTPTRTGSTTNRPPGKDGDYPGLDPWKSPYLYGIDNPSIDRYFKAPSGNVDAANQSKRQPRRLITLAIADCNNEGGPKPIEIRAIARFFMQQRAGKTSGNQPRARIEFVDIVSVLEPSFPDYRLYK